MNHTALSVVFLFLLAGPLEAAPSYTVIDLGTLGGAYSFPYDINSAGQVVGEWGNSNTFSGPMAGPNNRAFLYQNGAMQDLGTLGGTYSVAYGINDAGQVVGTAKIPTGYNHAFLFQGGTMQDLGTFGGDWSDAVGINNAGQVVGWADTSTPGVDFHAFLYESGVMQDLGTLGGEWTTGCGINESGQISGYAYTPTGGTHAIISGVGGWQDLGTLGGSTSFGIRINEAGQIVGFAEIASGEEHAFLYQNGTMQDVGTLGGAYSFGYGINDAGQVVGESGDSSQLFGGSNRAFLYQNGVMVDLNDLIDGGSGWLLASANAINNAGQIAGYGYINGQGHAFLLTPSAVPEPASVVLCLVGAIGVAFVAVRRKRTLSLPG